MSSRPWRPSLKVLQEANGTWIVIQEYYRRSGRILAGPFDTRALAVAARNSLRKAMHE